MGKMLVTSLYKVLAREAVLYVVTHQFRLLPRSSHPSQFIVSMDTSASGNKVPEEFISTLNCQANVGQ